jgi:hypothetical protein
MAVRTTLLAVLFLTNVALGAAGDGFKPKPYVAVDNVCAWPILTLMPDGGTK